MGKDNRKKLRNKLRLRNSANPAGFISTDDMQKMQSLDANHLDVDGDQSAPNSAETLQTNIPKLVRELDHINESTRENACMALAGIVLLGSGGEDEDDSGGDVLMTERQRDLVQRTDSHFSNDDVIRMVLERGAASKLSQKLCDPSYSVRIAAAGALRNLAIVGGYELCERLEKDDIMMLIMAALKQTVERILNLEKTVHVEQGNDAIDRKGLANAEGDMEVAKENKNVQRMEDRQKEQLETAKEILSLLAIMCEESSKATHAATLDASFVALIMRMLSLKQNDTLHREVVLSAAICMHITSDENESLAKTLEQNQEASKMLFSLLTNSNVSIRFRVVIAGIVFNTFTSLYDESSSSNVIEDKLKIVKHVFPTLMEATQFESVEHLNKMISALVQLAKDEKEEAFDEETNENALVSREWTNCVRAQTMSFEILTNAVSFLAFVDDDNNVMDDDDDDEFEDIDEEELTSEDISEKEPGSRVEFLEFVQQSQFITQVMACFAKSLNVSSVNTLVMSQSHGVEKMKQLQEASLRCLSCLCSTILAAPSDELCKYDIDGLWGYAHNVLEKNATQWQQMAATQLQSPTATNGSNDSMIQISELLEESIELITRLLWILSKKSPPSAQASQSNIGKCNTFHSIPFDQAKLLAMLLQGTVFSEETRVNCMGILGQLGQRPHTQEQNRALADVIASKLGDPSLAFVSELLNTVFDVYKDKTYDAVLSETKLLQKLQIFSNVLGNKLKQEQVKMKEIGNVEKVDEEAFYRTKEANFNLRRFLTYKSE